MPWDWNWQPPLSGDPRGVADEFHMAACRAVFRVPFLDFVKLALGYDNALFVKRLVLQHLVVLRSGLCKGDLRIGCWVGGKATTISTAQCVVVLVFDLAVALSLFGRCVACLSLGWSPACTQSETADSGQAGSAADETTKTEKVTAGPDQTITSSNETEEVGNIIAEVQEKNSADIETPGEDDNTAEHWQDNTTLDDINYLRPGMIGIMP
ncbi:hypothetical protein B0J14DRAFT_568641 [Halenospora varia]|nr:hypothetical protein B0J14DRAFT_568641 [Halenospora varia]